MAEGVWSRVIRTGSGLDRGRAFYQAHPGLSMVVAAVPISEFDGGRRAVGNGLAHKHATRKKCPVSWRAKVEHRGEGGAAIGSVGRGSHVSHRTRHSVIEGKSTSTTTRTTSEIRKGTTPRKASRRGTSRAMLLIT